MSPASSSRRTTRRTAFSCRQTTAAITSHGRRSINRTCRLKTIVFPTGRALRKVGDFHMEFERNDYSGEQQIIDTLKKQGKFIPSEVRRRIRAVAPRCAGKYFSTPTRFSNPAPPQCCGPLRLVHESIVNKHFATIEEKQIATNPSKRRVGMSNNSTMFR